MHEPLIQYSCQQNKNTEKIQNKPIHSITEWFKYENGVNLAIDQPYKY